MDEQQVTEAYDNAQAQRQQVLATEAPEATEPLGAPALSLVRDGIVAFVSAADPVQGPGMVETLRMATPPGEAQVMPPDLWAPFLAISKVLEMTPGAEAYAYDATAAATTNNGLMDAGNKLVTGSRDAALMRQIAQGEPPAEDEPTEETAGVSPEELM